MKKFLLILTALSLTGTAAMAQKLTIGERAAEIKSTRKMGTKQVAGEKIKVIEFFHCSNKQCAARLEELDRLAKKYDGTLEVTVVTRDPAEKAMPILKPESRSYQVVIDEDGKVFENYGVKYVPFAVLVDKKGKVIWFGNSSSLTEDMIKQAI